MSLSKAVPKGIRDKGCKRFTLQEPPPVPYVPEKDPVQETISALKSDQSLKTTIGEDAELRLPIWHCGTRKAFLMHVSTALDAIKKRGTFKAYKEACKAYVEQGEAVKQAKAALALLTAPTSEGAKDSDKASGKNCSGKEKASQKTKEGAALANAPAQELWAEYQADYNKAKSAAETAKNKRKAAATKMFQFYPKLLFSDAKYLWDKIVWEQMEAEVSSRRVKERPKGIFAGVIQRLRHISPSHCVSKQRS
jgi:hypothetical protein